MKKGTLLILLLSLFTTSLFAQATPVSILKEYFDSAENLDPIEGLWTLNVVRTLYLHDEIIGQEEENVRSEWGVKRVGNNKFKVIDIGEGSDTDKSGGFEAYFEKTGDPSVYIYKVNFKVPNWSATATAELFSEFTIEYEYFTGEAHMKANYRNYHPGLKLHWKFTWVKYYPGGA